MKLLIFGLIALYLGALIYIYLTQDSQVFNPRSIEKKEPIKLKDVEHITFEVEKGVVLKGIHKTSDNSPLVIYFGGNADDATRIVLHVKGFEIVAFNYRGFVNSGGKPSEKDIFSDALQIFDKYGENRDVIVVGRSLGTGVATYVASQRVIKGLILITPYDSIVSIGKKMYPYFPIETLSNHKFESVKYMLDVKAKVGLIEVEGDDVIPKYHFDKLKEKVLNLALHVELKDTTHGDVLQHPDFEKTIKRMIDVM
ncbi:MAG TPA: alpha/beta hydrolase [Sulfurospirillum arcachonense]|nr:alpha/beta hydrolase [Sulfurospirillum arcachonense]